MNPDRIRQQHLGVKGTMRGLTAILCFFYLIGPNLAISGPDPIGSIKKVEGQAYILRDGNSIPATDGARLFTNDTLRTSDNGALGVVFRDNAVMSLGPKTEIILNEFIFSPDQGQFSMIAKMIKGTAAYLSGLMVKLSPGSARVETPVATIGFRGTKCLIKVEGG